MQEGSPPAFFFFFFFFSLLALPQPSVLFSPLSAVPLFITHHSSSQQTNIDHLPSFLPFPPFFYSYTHLIIHNAFGEVLFLLVDLLPWSRHHVRPQRLQGKHTGQPHRVGKADTLSYLGQHFQWTKKKSLQHRTEGKREYNFQCQAPLPVSQNIKSICQEPEIIDTQQSNSSS